MKKMKKILAFALIAVSLFAVTMPAMAASWSFDIAKGQPYSVSAGTKSTAGTVRASVTCSSVSAAANCGIGLTLRTTGGASATDQMNFTAKGTKTSAYKSGQGAYGTSYNLHGNVWKGDNVQAYGTVTP